MDAKKGKTFRARVKELWTSEMQEGYFISFSTDLPWDLPTEWVKVLGLSSARPGDTIEITGRVIKKVGKGR